jgi:hypothetical protein
MSHTNGQEPHAVRPLQRPKAVGRWPSLFAGAVTAVIVLAGPMILPRPAAAVPTGSGLRSVLIVLVTWPASPQTPAAPPDLVTPASAAGFINSTMNSWYQQSSYGVFGGWTASSTLWLPIAPPRMDGRNNCGPTFKGDVRDNGERAATDAGADLSTPAVVLYYFSTVVPCSWAGSATPFTTPGSQNSVLINGSLTPLTVAHELGHTLGLRHAHAQACTDSSSQATPLSTSCQTVEYGDVYNAMGNANSGDFGVIQKADLGWLGGREQTASPLGGSYTLTMLETNGPGVQALRIEDGTEVFWLEYRRPVGVDSGLASWSLNGVLVRRQLAETGTALGSYLLDMTPGSASGFADAALPPGVTWLNPLGNMGVTVVSIGPGQASVTVHSKLKLVPNVIGLDTATAMSTLTAAGLVAQQQFVVDPTCNVIGTVKSQSPSPSTIVAPGTAVTVTVWVQPTYPRVCN